MSVDVLCVFNIINSGNLVGVTSIRTLQESPKELWSDVSPEILDGLVLNLGVFDWDGSQQNADTLGILVKDNFNVLCSAKLVLYKSFRTKTSKMASKIAINGAGF